MKPKHIVGSIVTEEGPQPFALHVASAKFETGTYVTPDPAQRELSVIQQQRFAQLVCERANVSFAQVRVGQYHCRACERWIDVTQPGAWSVTICTSCSLDRGSELREHYAALDASVTKGPETERDGVKPEPIVAVLDRTDAGSLLERAVEIALKAHRGQQDKAGAPYILHPLRLMLQMDTPEARMVAVLHDVVEDSGWTLDRLRDEGFPEAVIDAVAHMTRREGESYEAFVERAAQHPIARRVKQADLEDNMDVRRLGPLTEKDKARLVRYQKAWQRLRESE